MIFDRDLYDRIMRENSQFPDNPEDSKLWKVIQVVYNCSQEEAMTIAGLHCNSLSFYGLCRGKHFIEFPYMYWLEHLRDKDYISRRGYLEVGKEKIAELFGFSDRYPEGGEIKYIYDYDEVASLSREDIGINYKVHNRSGTGTHFMGGYPMNSQAYVSDSSYRGIRKKFTDVVPRNKFIWGAIV